MTEAANPPFQSASGDRPGNGLLGTPLLERVGNTPLIRLDKLTGDLPGAPGAVQILGKAEWANPGGSVKDRAASASVADAR